MFEIIFVDDPYRLDDQLVVCYASQEASSNGFLIRETRVTVEETTSMTPLVTIVVPTLNRADSIRRCLSALLAQDYPCFEVIVVDDASTDETPSVLASVADLDPRVHVMRNEHHLGANPSRNRGVEQANGSLVAFLDDDCIPSPGWLKTLSSRFSSKDTAAVTGLVVDPEPTNVFELAFKGTHRVVGPGPARRLVGGNMAIRRELVREIGWDEDRQSVPKSADGIPDTSVSGRCDEEGVFLRLKALGYRVETEPGASVLHERHFTARSFFKQAFRGGVAAAGLVYKYRLPTRLDVAPFLLAWISTPLVLIRPWVAAIPALFFGAALAAVAYNDLVLKGKTVSETIRSFPALLAYYHVRVFGYALEAVRLRLFPRGGIKRVGTAGIARPKKNHAGRCGDEDEQSTGEAKRPDQSM